MRRMDGKAKKLQRLKSQLYISDNSDLEDLETLEVDQGRHIRKRERIDYNENKRVRREERKSPSHHEDQFREKVRSGREKDRERTRETDGGIKGEDFKEPVIEGNIDIGFVKRIVDYDLNKKMSVLGDEREHSIQQHSEGSGHTEKNTEAINDEIKKVYFELAQDVVDKKERDISRTVNRIDREVAKVKDAYEKGESVVPTLYPAVFNRSFKEMESEIQNEEMKRNYRLRMLEEQHQARKDIIKRRYENSVTENRSSIVRYLRHRIEELDDEIERKTTGMDLETFLSLVEYGETKRRVSHVVDELRNE